jgi:hypothetical protein
VSGPDGLVTLWILAEIRAARCVWLCRDTRSVPPHGERLSSEEPVGASGGHRQLIPSPIDQNSWAQSRKPMDMMVQGRSLSLFQASQQ